MPFVQKNSTLSSASLQEITVPTHRAPFSVHPFRDHSANLSCTISSASHGGSQCQPILYHSQCIPSGDHSANPSRTIPSASHQRITVPNHLSWIGSLSDGELGKMIVYRFLSRVEQVSHVLGNKCFMKIEWSFFLNSTFA